MEAETTRRFLSFDLDGAHYAIEVERVEVVLEMVRVTRVPRAPAHLRGVINYRGTVIPVADLRVPFSDRLSDLAAAQSIVVLEVKLDGDPLTIGVLADSVREVVDIPVSSIDPAPAWGNGRLDGFLLGVCRREDGFMLILDMDRIFAPREAA